MGRIWLACLGLAGCQQFFGLDAPVLAPDAPPDANEVCIGSGLVSYCVPVGEVPTNVFEIAPAASLTLDTTMASPCVRTQLAGVEVCVVPALTASIAGTLRATGSLPIVLAVFDQITVDGVIDVSSGGRMTAGNLDGSAGAGSGPASCPALDGASSVFLQGGAGGGGGSFAIAGGTGGASSGPSTGTPAGPVVDEKALRGGCPGGKGGMGTDGPAGTSGLGGGAIYIVAATSITVNGTINASGGGGGGGGKRAGGGGGGSGGLVAFDAPMLALGKASIYANGGGGGGGGDSSNAGADGSVSMGPSDRALGGTALSDKGGPGGAGSVADQTGVAGGPPQDSAAGGGGGGGGGGLITIYSTVLSNQAVISPPPR